MSDFRGAWQGVHHKRLGSLLRGCNLEGNEWEEGGFDNFGTGEDGIVVKVAAFFVRIL